MIQFTADDFRDLCRSGEVHVQMSTLEQRRKDGVRHFWIYLVGTIVLCAAVLFSLIAYDWPIAGMIIAAVVLFIGIVLALQPMARAKEGLKHPVLEALAVRGGLQYLPEGFDPPVFPGARKLLFGSVSSFSFTDLFHGTDADGKRFAIYEGTLTRKQGKNSSTIFRGQLYAFQRRSTGSGEIAVVPDKGLFNFIKPRGVERVRFDGDPEFESKFEVYATHPASALGLLRGESRRRLLEIRQAGRVLVYAGPEDVLVAVNGRDRFEPGSMFRSRPPEERVKQMFDEVCASLATLRELKTAFD